ncbi:MAG: hypothetical protein IAI50_08260 [Candidatus Eremiobacteraeota bacterium]|nr:hypothetical protein [Candidatus Eremiobacteraeota bacterium]
MDATCMFTASTIRRALIACATFGMLAACGGGSTGTTAPLVQSPFVGAQSVVRQVTSVDQLDNSLLPQTTPRIFNRPVTSPSFMDVDASTNPLIFVSDVSDGVVDIYPQAGKSQKMVGQITGFAQPQGLATDTKADLFVANTNDSNVLVYAPPYTKTPMLTIDDVGQFPAAVAVSSTGLVAVTNICKAPDCRPGTASVSFYPKDSSKACATVSDTTNFPRITFAAFDKSGNLYIDGTIDRIITAFGIVSGGCKATSITNIAVTYTIGFPGSLQVDNAGRIAVTDGVRYQVETFDPPTDGELGAPTSLTALKNSKNDVSSALLASGKDLYGVDSGTGRASEFAYGSDGAALDSIAGGGQPIGVAVTPPILP